MQSNEHHERLRGLSYTLLYSIDTVDTINSDTIDAIALSIKCVLFVTREYDIENYDVIT